jgi:hypothetical protein
LGFDLLGLSISTGMISRLERQAATELEAPVEELRQHVRHAASAHIDETSWKQGRDKAWLWGAVTDLVTVFTIATSRGAEVARGMLGSDRRKVVISDRFKSDHWIKRRQFCCVRSVNRICFPVGPPPMMERPMFPSRRSDHGEGPAAGGGVGNADRRVATERTPPAGVLSAAWAQPGHDAKLGLQA